MQTKKILSSIAGASITITIANLLSKSAGFLREAFIAAYFGLSSDYELYLVAFVIPMTINVSVQYFTQNYFIPSYYRFKSRDTNSGESFTEKILTGFFIGAVTVSILLQVFSSQIFNNFFGVSDPDSLELCRNIFAFALLTIPINAATSVIHSKMIADNKFISPSYSQLFLNLFIIILIPIFSSEWGVYVLPGGSLVGYLAQFIFLAYRSKLKLRFSINVLLKQKLGIRTTLSFLIVAMVVEFLSQLYSFVDRLFYPLLREGGLAALNYAFTLFQLPLGIISLAITTAIFPSFSSAFSNEDFKGISDKLGKAFIVICAIFIPISLCFILVGESIVGLLLQRGEFSNSDTVMTAGALAVLSFSIFFYALYAVMNKLVYSFMLSWELIIITLSGIVVKVIFNFILVNDFHEVGLAAATSVSYLTIFLLTSGILIKHLSFTIILDLLKNIIWYLLLALIAVSISLILTNSLTISSDVNYLRDYLFLLVFGVSYAGSLIVLNDRVVQLIKFS